MWRSEFLGYQLSEIQDRSYYKRISGVTKYTNRVFEMCKSSIWIFIQTPQMANFSQLKVISGRILQYHRQTPALCSSHCVMSVCSKSQLFCNIKKGWTTKNAMTSHRQQIPFRYSYMIFMVLLGKTKLANIALKRFQSRVPTLAFIIRRP